MKFHGKFDNKMSEKSNENHRHHLHGYGQIKEMWILMRICHTENALNFSSGHIITPNRQQIMYSTIFNIAILQFYFIVGVATHITEVMSFHQFSYISLCLSCYYARDKPLFFSCCMQHTHTMSPKILSIVVCSLMFLLVLFY